MRLSPFTAVVVAVTGLHLHRAYTASGIVGCTGDVCDSIINAFLRRDLFLQTLLSNVLMLLLPALIGVFWAAPLVARELETGTYRLVWTQSVPRTRWLTAKLAVAGLAGLVATGVLTVLVTWWYGPIDEVNSNQFSPAVFGGRDLVPVGYAAFAFGLGVLAGVVSRRTLTAMSIKNKQLVCDFIQDLFTKGDTAWTRADKDDKAMVQEMLKGSTLTVAGESDRGTKTVDTYSLKGFSAAYKEINKACGIK